MKASVCLIAASAALAMAAGPLAKRKVHTHVETEVVYVTVTEGALKSMFRQNQPTPSTSSTSSESTSTTSSTPPPPPPSTTVEVVYETPTPAPAPEPTTEVVVVAQAQPTETVQKSEAAVVAAAAPSDFASTATYHHNIHRENNSAPALSWGAAYASYAAETAAKCKFEHDMVPGGGGYGQNIAMWASSGDAEAVGANKAIASAITNMWYNGEINLYPSSAYGQDNPDFSNFEGWGHYSQVVWAGTQQVGCDAHYCPPGTMFATMGAWFSVCNYYPAGNMGGQYGANVLKPQGRQTITADS